MSLRVVVVHNRYRSANPSGENKVVDENVQSLRSDGIEVVTYFRESDEIDAWGALRKAGLLVRPTYSREDAKAFRSLLDDFRPQVVHLHNPFPMISPHVIGIAKQRGAQVVQTVHNYRRTCVNGIHFRDGSQCTDCVGRALAWPAILHGCYQGSRLASAPMVAAQALHKSTWRKVDLYLAVGEGVKDLLIGLGTPSEKVLLFPNAVKDPGKPAPIGRGVLFAGRLSAEKGVRLLLDAWSLGNLGRYNVLNVAGDGALINEVRTAGSRDNSISALGFLDHHSLRAEYEACELVVVPSLCFEAHPLAIEEAHAHGRPVVAVRSEVTRRYVDPTNGWLAEATASSLASVLAEALASRSELDRRAASARADFERRAGRDEPRLSDVYKRLVGAST